MLFPNLFVYIFYHTMGHENCHRHSPLHFSQSTPILQPFSSRPIKTSLACWEPSSILFHFHNGEKLEIPILGYGDELKGLEWMIRDLSKWRHTNLTKIIVPYYLCRANMSILLKAVCFSWITSYIMADTKTTRSYFLASTSISINM